MKEITKEKLNKYIKLAEKALKKVKQSNPKGEEALDILNLSECYYKDALHFKGKDDLVNSFAAINYSHAFLDIGARLKLFKVKDSKLFMID